MADKEVLDRVIELIAQRGDRNVSAQDDIAGLGLDSIDVVYILSSFERSHEAEFEDADFDQTGYGTVSDLAETIRTRIEG